MKVGDLVRYVAAHVANPHPEDDDEIGMIVDCCEDGWYWKVYWIKDRSVHHVTRGSLEVISETR